jgi:hypothetical protein
MAYDLLFIKNANRILEYPNGFEDQSTFFSLCREKEESFQKNKKGYARIKMASWKTQSVPFWKQRIWYVAAILGLIVGILLVVIIQIFFMGHAVAPANHLASKDDTVTISIPDTTLTISAQSAIQRNQSQLPVQVKNIGVTTYPGNRIDIAAAVPALGGVDISVLFMASPIVNNGKITFHVFNAQLGGLTISSINSAIESALNQQFSDFGQGHLLQGFNYQLIGADTVKGALVITARVNAS